MLRTFVSIDEAAKRALPIPLQIKKSRRRHSLWPFFMLPFFASKGAANPIIYPVPEPVDFPKEYCLTVDQASNVAVSSDGQTVVGHWYCRSSKPDGSWPLPPITYTGFYKYVQGSSSTFQIDGVDLKKNRIEYLALSHDGTSAVFTTSNDWRDYGRAYHWSEESGTKRLFVPGQSIVGARDISGDGTTAVGGYYDTSKRIQQAVIWDVETGKARRIDGLRSDRFSEATGVSYDGGIVVGTLQKSNTRWGGWYRAFYYTQGGTVVELGTLTDTHEADSWAYDVSGDGTTVVGSAEYINPDNSTEYNPGYVDGAFRWTEATGMEHLRFPNEEKYYGAGAITVSYDGKYVAGNAFRIDSDYSIISSAAFRWDENGDAINIGSLSRLGGNGITYVSGISDDGTIIVGSSVTDCGDRRTFIWRETPSGTTAKISDIQCDDDGDDGKGFTDESGGDDGTQPSNGGGGDGKSPPDDVGSGPQEPPVSGVMLDYVNTLKQVSQSASEQVAGVFHIGQLAQYTLGQSMNISVGGSRQRASIDDDRNFALRLSMGAAGGAEAPDARVAGLSAAVRLGSYLTAGGYLGLGDSKDTLGGFGIEGDFNSYGLFLEGGQRGSEGFSWKISAAQTGADVTISRALQLENTEAGVGRSEMLARAAALEAGYGFKLGKSIVTPFAKLTHATATRDGYTESAVGFPVTYDDYEISETVVTIGADLDVATSDRGVLTLSAGLEWDLDRDAGTLSGSSDIPGMTSFEIDGPAIENDRRLFGEVHYNHGFGKGQSVDIGLKVAQSPYLEDPTVMGAIGYQVSF